MTKASASKRTSLALAVALATGLSLSSPVASAALPVAVNGQEMPTLAPLLEQVTPAVVNISVSGTRMEQRQFRDPFEFFFGPNPNNPGQQRERPFQGLGSGVIIDADKGHVITNSHVIDGADEIKVTLKDGREFEATKVGEDKESDIALLKIDAEDLTSLALADSDDLRVGDFAIAVGNPFGLGQTVTSGIISALGRSGLNIENFENFIQTDAAINSGNSGGALVNLKGELIGINTAILGPNGGNVGIGFAIPSNMVQNLSAQILEFGEVRRGVLGVIGGELTPELAEAMGYSSQHGAFINQVMAESAASDAGLMAGDIITKVNGKSIRTFAELRAKIATLGAGKEVKITAFRDGEFKDFNVVLKERTEEQVKARALHQTLEGATLSTSADTDGVLVDSVEAQSPAERAGLLKGDLIIGVNRVPVKDLKELRELLEEKGGVKALNIQREGSSLFLILR